MFLERTFLYFFFIFWFFPGFKSDFSFGSVLVSALDSNLCSALGSTLALGLSGSATGSFSAGPSLTVFVSISSGSRGSPLPAFFFVAASIAILLFLLTW